MRASHTLATLEPWPGHLATVDADRDSEAAFLSLVVAVVADADSFDARIIISLLTYSTNH